MGRKPNPIVIEFFDRGEKIPDSSNRYQHTCKACGARFPKGRIETLTSHIIKKCPAMTAGERQAVLLSSNNFAPMPNPDSARALTSQASAPRRLTALETLAEVSRQHHQMIENPHSTDISTTQSHRSDMGRFQLQESWTPDNPPLNYESRIQRGRLSESLLTKEHFRANLPAPVQSVPRIAADAAQVNESAEPLNMAAASRLAAEASARYESAMLDPRLAGGDGQGNQTTLESNPGILTSHLEYEATQNATWPGMTSAGSGPIYPAGHWSDAIAEVKNMGVNHNELPDQDSGALMITADFTAEYGQDRKRRKQKIRGPFTPDRRKEVQSVRKSGACIRCRMLKKPCSEETPCRTCNHIESARRWKLSCNRDRMQDLLDVFQAGVHAVLAYQQVGAAKSHFSVRRSLVQVVVSHYPETSIFATLSSLEGHQTQMASLDESLECIRMLDNDIDDLPAKIEGYMRQMSPIFYAREPSPVMKVVLAKASEVVANKRDTLLSHALHFYGFVHILIDHELKWDAVERRTVEGKEIDTPILESDRTYQLLCMQLNAAAERKADLLGKTVLGELERRLLSKASNASFECFLVGLIILNCVEKSNWLFHSWEQEYLKSRWPLDGKSPRLYIEHGATIADLTQMLLTMRNCPPNVKVRQDGILDTEADATHQDFFRLLNLNCKDVLDKQEHPVFNPADSRSFDLNLTSRLLLPTDLHNSHR